MPLIELIQDNNTTNKLPLCYKGYADMKPCLLPVHDHQVILEKLKQEKTLTIMWLMTRSEERREPHLV